MLPWLAQLNELNPFVNYEFDAVVATFAVIIKNALQETRDVSMGGKTRSVAKYKLEELLEPDFRFAPENPLAALKTIEGYEEVG